MNNILKHVKKIILNKVVFKKKHKVNKQNLNLKSKKKQSNGNVSELKNIDT